MLMTSEVLHGEVASLSVLDKNLPELNEACRQRFAGLLVRNNILAGTRIVAVIFESRARENVVVPGLHEKDLLAAEAAEESGGLIAYDPIPGESVCLWETEKQMKDGTKTPEHAAAAKLAMLAYQSYRVSQWDIEVLNNAGEANMMPVSLLGYDGSEHYRIFYENGQAAPVS